MKYTDAETNTQTKEGLFVDADCQSGNEHNKRMYLIIKRIQDIVLSFIALVVLLPLLLIIALIIFIDDPKGSPIFSQDRCGKNGKVFKLFKFRTMCVDAEDKLDNLLESNESDGPAFKIKDDPRINRVGNILRKTGLDELPQLINILKGDMSIVGPRPPLPREVEQYNEYQMKRLSVTPGLTCYWQIQPDRNDITFDEWMNFDIKYIEEMNFLIDWKIIFLTVKTVITFQGR